MDNRLTHVSLVITDPPFNKKPGRPKGSTTAQTETVGPVRVTPEQKSKFIRLGGAAWLKRMLDQA